MRPTVCICCLLQATDFPENKRGFQPTEAALVVQRPCLERGQMKRMLTACRMRNTLVWTVGFSIFLFSTHWTEWLTSFGAGASCKEDTNRAQDAERPAWSEASCEEDANCAQDAECSRLERRFR